MISRPALTIMYPRLGFLPNVILLPSVAGLKASPGLVRPHQCVLHGQGFDSLTRLRVLDVSNNRLSSLPSLAGLTQLQVQKEPDVKVSVLGMCGAQCALTRVKLS